MMSLLPCSLLRSTQHGASCWQAHARRSIPFEGAQAPCVAITAPTGPPLQAAERVAARPCLHPLWQSRPDGPALGAVYLFAQSLLPRNLASSTVPWCLPCLYPTKLAENAVTQLHACCVPELDIPVATVACCACAAGLSSGSGSDSQEERHPCVAAVLNAATRFFSARLAASSSAFSAVCALLLSMESQPS